MSEKELDDILNILNKIPSKEGRISRDIAKERIKAYYSEFIQMNVEIDDEESKERKIRSFAKKECRDTHHITSCKYCEFYGTNHCIFEK